MQPLYKQMHLSDVLLWFGPTLGLSCSWTFEIESWNCWVGNTGSIHTLCPEEYQHYLLESWRHWMHRERFGSLRFRQSLTTCWQQPFRPLVFNENRWKRMNRRRRTLDNLINDLLSRCTVKVIYDHVCASGREQQWVSGRTDVLNRNMWLILSLRYSRLPKTSACTSDYDSVTSEGERHVDGRIWM